MAVTVFMEGPVSRRPEILKAFFGRWGVEPSTPVIKKTSLISLGSHLWDAFRFSTLTAS